jgi:hypothetical protein
MAEWWRAQHAPPSPHARGLLANGRGNGRGSRLALTWLDLRKLASTGLWCRVSRDMAGRNVGRLCSAPMPRPHGPYPAECCNPSVAISPKGDIATHVAAIGSGALGDMCELNLASMES